jgi:hypothetical protein
VPGLGARAQLLHRSEVFMNVSEFTNVSKFMYVSEFMDVSNASKGWLGKSAEKRKEDHGN